MIQGAAHHAAQRSEVNMSSSFRFKVESAAPASVTDGIAPGSARFGPEDQDSGKAAQRPGST